MIKRTVDSLLELEAPSEQAPKRKPSKAKVRSVRNVMLSYQRSNANGSESSKEPKSEFPVCI